MMPNCRVLSNKNQNQPAYSTSAFGGDHIDFWIQDPISQQPFDTSLEYRIEGIYVQIKARDIPLPKIDRDLINEFSAWEAASDEALMNFEREL
jgi:hypothetical protein